MRYLVTSEEMKLYEQNTMNLFQVDALELMERAALAAATEIKKKKGTGNRILVAAGPGNNGGDGLAAGRLLALEGQAVSFVLIGDEHKYTPQTRQQIAILLKYGFPIQSRIEKREYDIVIDALVGIGLSREITDQYAEAIDIINNGCGKNAFVFSLDIPSGVHAVTGEVMGSAVRADETITFGFAKRGHYLYPGSEYTGALTVADIGITKHSFQERVPELKTFDQPGDLRMPRRVPWGNKGSFGKVLLIAGQTNMAGACVLAGGGCLRSGAGMLKILTHESNRIILQSTLPEAITGTFSAGKVMSDRLGVLENLRADLQWAGSIVIGPGLGQSAAAETLLNTVLTESELPIVIDADAIRLLGKYKRLIKILAGQRSRTVILTPHLGELAGLTGSSIEKVKTPDFSVMKRTAEKLHCILVCKDARTFCYEPGPEENTGEGNAYLNSSGNSGMATAGSGDVLAGIIGSLLAQGQNGFDAACNGVYLHGLAGDLAAAEKSKYGLIASDLVAALPEVLRKYEELFMKEHYQRGWIEEDLL